MPIGHQVLVIISLHGDGVEHRFVRRIKPATGKTELAFAYIQLTGLDLGEGKLKDFF